MNELIRRVGMPELSGTQITKWTDEKGNVHDCIELHWQPEKGGVLRKVLVWENPEGFVRVEYSSGEKFAMPIETEDEFMYLLFQMHDLSGQKFEEIWCSKSF